MITLKSYASGEWRTGSGTPRVVHHAVTGEPLAELDSTGLDFAAMLDFGRTQGGTRLRAMTFPERAALLKTMAGILNDHREELNTIATSYGATARDAALDVDGGIGTLAFYASLGAKKLPDSRFLVDGDEARLSKGGNFVGRHVYVPLEGVAVQVNAYNFPCWGMLEKLAPAVLAGVPTIVKPATPSAWLAFRAAELLIASDDVPDGVVQLICGSVGDLFDHLTCQDLVSFTGSAATGRKIRSHPNIIASSVRVNIEADSLNCIVLGEDVSAESDTFSFFVKEVVREMTVKAGQKCTAIRRVIVPEARAEDVVRAVSEKLASFSIGDPTDESVRMGPLVDRDAVASAREGIDALTQEAEVVFGDPSSDAFEPSTGAFMAPVLLLCRDGQSARAVHEVEVFGPAATIVTYGDQDEAIALANRGGGSLVGSIFTEDAAFAEAATLGLAPYHGRVMIMDHTSAPESTGHGVVMPHLIHGGPGRAGGGEELGGVRSLHHYMQRVALQGHPKRLEGILESAL